MKTNYRLEERVVDGDVVMVKVFPSINKHSKQYVYCRGFKKGKAARFVADARGQILRCAVCGNTITRTEEKSSGMCGRCR